MFNYYLLNRSYNSAASSALQANLQNLNDIVVVVGNTDDYFLKHESIWNVETEEGSFSDVIFSKLEDKQFSYTVLPKLLEAIRSVDNEIIDFTDFDSNYTLYNAFYGIQFIDLDESRCLSDSNTYHEYRNRCMWNVTPESLWDRRSALFKKVVLCPSVEKDLISIGGTYLNQIIDKIKELDQYLTQNNENKGFNWRDCVKKTTLVISEESKSTMGQKKYADMRVFSMPDGSREIFELHIKAGNLRMHFLPKEDKVYIGYIGKHLPTVLFK